MKKLFSKIDILEELEPYMDRLERAKVKDGKILCCSPFRMEKHPSFVIWVDAGNWLDSGTGDKGTFIELLAFLSGESEFIIEAELYQKYGTFCEEKVTLRFNVDIQNSTIYDIIPKSQMEQYLYRHPYLGNRGISERVQKAFRIGYDRFKRAVVIPWLDIEGNPVRLKFRSIDSKKFWYSSEGQRIRNHLYGLNFVRLGNFDTVWVTEAEIDCLTLWTHGIPAVATGTAHISVEQLQLLKRTPNLTRIVIAADNDEAGERFREQLIRELGGLYVLEILDFPHGVKDVNSLSGEQLDNLTTQPVKYFIL